MGPDRQARYRAFDLAIRSDLALPGAMAADSDAGASVDVEIIEGPAVLEGASSTLGPYRLAGDQLQFSRRGVGDYLCEGGRRIVVERAPGADAFEVRGSLIATALPALLWTRGEIVLHAAAAVLPGARRAVAIGGASGAGKSTILDQMLSLGSTLIGDDSLRLRPAGSAVRASGLPAGLFLGDQGRAFKPAPPEQQAASAELAALVVLERPRTREAPCFRRLRGSDALETLLAGRHRSRVPRLLGFEGRLFPTLSRLAEQLPVYHWRRREGALTLEADEIEFLVSLDQPACPHETMTNGEKIV